MDLKPRKFAAAAAGKIVQDKKRLKMWEIQKGSIRPRIAGWMDRAAKIIGRIPGVNIRKFEVFRIIKTFPVFTHKGFRIRLLDSAASKDFIEKCCMEKEEDGCRFKLIPSSQYAYVKLFSYQNEEYIKKEYLHRGFFDLIKDFIRGPRASRSLEGDMLLKKKGFNAPRSLMTGKKGKISFIIYNRIQNAEDLQSIIIGCFKRPFDKHDLDLKRALATEAGRVVGRMHALGISHGDLRLGNIMVEFDQENRLKFWFLDNERTLLYTRLPEKKRIKNLVQINIIPGNSVSSSDRLRFYIHYLKEVPELAGRKKELAKKIAQITAGRLEKIMNKNLT
jgi:tRNA A-37 threonylcarbamoyl transferase component Bud32